MTRTNILTVSDDDDNVRLDRWLKHNCENLAFANIQKLLRTGQIRVGGKRAKPGLRLKSGDIIRIPPALVGDAVSAGHQDGDCVVTTGKPTLIKDIIDNKRQKYYGLQVLYEDQDLVVFNKPAGLAVHGGTGVKVHVDDLLRELARLTNSKLRLVHRLDRQTAGILIVARSRIMAKEMAVIMRKRQAHKFYWALLHNVPKQASGRISAFIARSDDSSKSTIAAHGDAEARHAISEYKVIDHAGTKFSWVLFRLMTGRTHQLRVHSAHIGTPIIGDAKYAEDLATPPGMTPGLQLLARQIIFRHPLTGLTIDIKAPLPAHMQKNWQLLGFAGNDESIDYNEWGI